MAIRLNEFLNKIEEEQNGNNIINIINKLFDIGIFDNDGEFRGWNSENIESHYKNEDYLKKDLEKLRDYLREHGIHSNEKVFYVIFAAGEDYVKTEKELEETIEAVKDMES